MMEFFIILSPVMALAALIGWHQYQQNVGRRKRLVTALTLYMRVQSAIDGVQKKMVGDAELVEALDIVKRTALALTLAKNQGENEDGR